MQMKSNNADWLKTEDKTKLWFKKLL